MKKIFFHINILAFLLVSNFSFGQTQLSEGFETGMPVSFPNPAADFTLGSGTWTMYYVIGSASYLRSGSYCARIYTSSGRYMITPTLNTCGTITFWCRTQSTTVTDGLKIQKSVNGGGYSDVQTFTITSTYTQFTCNVNDLNSDIKIKFINNGSSVSMYVDDLTITTAEPTTQASGISFSNVTASGMQIDWTNGNGANRAVFIKEGSGAITNPSDASSYTASSNWASKGTQLGTSGYYCVYNGSSTNVTLTNLSTSTTYYVYVYEYFGSGTTSNYLTSSTCTANQATASPTITVGSVTAFGDQTVNTISSEKSYTVSGADLVDDIVITPPSCYKISTTSGSGFTTSVSLTPSGGTVSSTTIYVRFEPTAIQSYSGNITHTSTSTTTQNVAVSGSGVAPDNPSGVGATVISATQLDIAFTKNANNNNVMLAWNSTADFGVPTNGNAYIAGNAITGGGTVLYVGGTSPYNHTSLTSCTDYYYKVWSVDAGNYYSSGITTNENTTVNMSFVSSTATQTNTSEVNVNASNQEIIGIRVITTGPCNAMSASSFSFNTDGGNSTGTTAPTTDISNAKLWFTGTSGTFATTSQLGATTTSPNGTFTINSFSQSLSEGTNYFWLTYDIPAGAVWSNYVDAKCTSVTLSDGAHTPTTQNPTGSRQIPSVRSVTASGSGYVLRISGTVSLYFNSNLTTSNSTFVHNGSLYVKGDFDNSATYTSGDGSNIVFCGTAAQEISSSSDLTFHDVEISNSAGVTMSSGNISVGGLLTLTSGVLTTGSNYIDLGSAGSISEESPTASAPTSYVSGTVKATRNIGSSVEQTFGGLGLVITETNSANSTAVTRVTGTACTSGSNSSIKRYFDITPTTNSGLNATIKIYYFDNELTGTPSIDEGDIVIYKAPSPYTEWTAQSYTTRDLANNWYSKTGVTSFSRWTLADKDAPLPINLLSFSVSCEEDNIKLEWTTSSETNNDYFTIERSDNGINFVPVKTITGAGNSNSLLQYSYIDKPEEIITKQTTFYYRLKQTDFDGKYTYSNVLYTDCNESEKNIKLISIQPNPASTDVDIIMVSSEDKEIYVLIYDNIGKIIEKKLYKITAGQSFNNLDVDKLKEGIYIFNIITNDGINVGNRRIIKKNKLIN